MIGSVNVAVLAACVWGHRNNVATVSCAVFRIGWCGTTCTPTLPLCVAVLRGSSMAELLISADRWVVARKPRRAMPETETGGTPCASSDNIQCTQADAGILVRCFQG